MFNLIDNWLHGKCLRALLCFQVIDMYFFLAIILSSMSTVLTVIVIGKITTYVCMDLTINNAVLLYFYTWCSQYLIICQLIQHRRIPLERVRKHANRLAQGIDVIVVIGYQDRITLHNECLTVCSNTVYWCTRRSNNRVCNLKSSD